MKNKKTLYWKFILTYIVFAILCFVTIATFSSRMYLNHLTIREADSLYKEASYISNRYARLLYSGSISKETALSQLSALDTYISAPIWIIDSNGKIILDTRADLIPIKERTVSEFNPALSSYYITGNFFGSFTEATLSVFSPITVDYKVIGYVIIHKPMSYILESRENILNITYLTAGILFIMSLIILIVFTEIVYIPLSKITKAAEEYASGNMHYQISVDNMDEMGYLAGTLNYMADAIASSEDTQKKFIANVSHDFRSPLTSIRGYLEAMIDGTIPAEMHEKYLKIVLNETDRLKKLTDSLLELNNLNVKGTLMNISDFDINAIIKKTAETFEVICRQKQISFHLVLSGDNLFVNADMSKIQQVLYNLIDNAIKFSNNNSEIKIETTEKNNKVFVSVKDYGIGIPKESLPMIFDRFYKTDLSRGKDKKGTGLGLSIVKEIIQSHNENINVISTQGAGTEFIFTLPRSKDMNDF